MESISLINLQRLIKAGIEAQHESAYWITAEINELKTNSAGHCYLELVQKSEKTDFIEARTSAVIWASMFRLLKSYFETSTGRALDSGIKILIKAYVQYHELYGLSLNIIDIDPTYTVGSIELQKQKTIAQLQEEGVFDMNRELEFPILPKRIAIISSKQAAGYQDFIRQLSDNEYGYKFFTQLFTASLQGKDAEKAITAALDNIYNQIDNFDIVAIIRGGGSQADLACFDSYRLAYHVAQFPLPVVTGIGHDKDVSITDMVAHHMLKTPTAVAAFIVDAILEQESELIQLTEQLANIVRDVSVDEKNRLGVYISRMHAVTRRKIEKEQVRLTEWIPKQLRTLTYYLIKEEKQKLSQNLSKLELNNPHNILKRGYSLTLYKGKKISSIAAINENTEIETLLADGKLISQIKSINKS